MGLTSSDTGSVDVAWFVIFCPSFGNEHLFNCFIHSWHLFLLFFCLEVSSTPPSTWLIYTKNSAWGSPSFRNPSPILHLSEFPPKVLRGTYFALASSAIHLCLLPDCVLLEARVPILSIASLVPKSTLDTADALNRLLRTVTPICT